MPHPRNLRERKASKDISPTSGDSYLLSTCRPFSRLMKKGVNFIWNQAHDDAFHDIKKYLTNPPVLAAPTMRKSFILYTRALYHSLGALSGGSAGQLTT